jgi:hypothetical protein
MAGFTISRHERDQSFLVPVRKKFRPGPGEKKILVPVPAGKVLGLGPGPSQKNF